MGLRTRLAVPRLGVSQRGERVFPTRSVRVRESHPLPPAAGLGALGPCLPAPPEARPPGTPAPTYQAGGCGKGRADKTSVCSPALGSTGGTAEARNLTLRAGSSAGTSERRPRPMSAGRDGRSEDLTSGPAPPCPERCKPESCPAHLVPGRDCHLVAVGVEQVKSAWGLRPTRRARQRTGALTETFHQLTVSFKLWMTGSV